MKPACKTSPVLFELPTFGKNFKPMFDREHQGKTDPVLFTSSSKMNVGTPNIISAIIYFELKRQTLP